jgi:c-di-GMP-binding flagellar brake protein YcgR
MEILDGTDPPVVVRGIFQPPEDVILEGYFQPVVDPNVTVVLSAGSPADLAAGTSLRVGYGDYAGYHEFDSTVVEAHAGEPAEVVIEPARNLTTVQRRGAIRADVDLPVACALLDQDEMMFLRATGTIGNLGGGGLAMAIGAAEILVEGALLALAMTLPTSKASPVLALAKVVAVELPDSDDDEAIVRMRFTQIGAEERDLVERYVYRTLGGGMPAKLWTKGKLTQLSP